MALSSEDTAEVERIVATAIERFCAWMNDPADSLPLVADSLFHREDAVVSEQRD